VTGGLTQSLAGALDGRYRIESEVGRGGMATVFLAEDLKHGRRVAIKVLDPEVAAAIGHDRFLREIEIVARLNHPHILPLHDSGEANGELYYVTPFIEGESLRALLDRGKPLPVEQALRLAREAAAGLGHAHHRGLVHLDVKPENILLSDGIALVADFGIARSATAADPRAGVSGLALGTPLYMAPEQFLPDGEVDARTDLYALACVLYEMLAGRPPFAGAAPEILAYEHLSVEPSPVTEHRPDVPPAVAALLSRAMAKAPADRYATAARFIETLALATLEPAAPASREAATVPNNLPPERTRFIGREANVAECVGLLRDTPLLTLTGVGGCGKTRLALRVADATLAAHPAGVWFVDMAPLSSPERVPQAVAAVLGVTEEANRTLAETLARHIGGSSTVLLVDNCEHLLSACAELIDDLLVSCPRLRVLATSREGLGVRGERLYGVRSLTMPEADRGGWRGVETSEAVRLFVDRARMAVPDFAVNEDNASGIAEICRRLDGIPLAIELAAARMRLLSLEEICRKLDDRFRLLTGGERALPRHQTLRATIQWSYDNLDGPMRELFEALSVFAGGWTLEAAAAVVGENPDELEVLDLMSGLVDKSLVVVGREGRTTRYHMLETIRQFALERLGESGRGATARERHLEFNLGLVAQAEANFDGPKQADWFRRLDQELENLLAAHAWCDHAEGGAQKGLRLAGGMRLYWIARGLFALGLRTVSWALERDPYRERTRARGRALLTAGWLATRMGDPVSARGLLEESVEICRSLGDESGAAGGLSLLGVATFAQGDAAAAHRYLDEAVASAQGIDKVTALNSLAVVLAVGGDPARASLLCEQALSLSRDMGNVTQTAASLANLAMTRGLLEDRAAARQELIEAFDLSERASLVAIRQGVLETMAREAAACGEMEQAARFWGAADTLLERFGGVRGSMRDRILLPMIARARVSLGEPAFAASYDQGRMLRDDDVTAEARGWLAAAGH
jgi:non-specific serine/threonine protein kinase